MIIKVIGPSAWQITGISRPQLYWAMRLGSICGRAFIAKHLSVPVWLFTRIESYHARLLFPEQLWRAASGTLASRSREASLRPY